EATTRPEQVIAPPRTVAVISTEKRIHELSSRARSTRVSPRRHSDSDRAAPARLHRRDLSERDGAPRPLRLTRHEALFFLWAVSPPYLAQSGSRRRFATNRVAEATEGCHFRKRLLRVCRCREQDCLPERTRPMTLPDLKHNRKLLFWSLHAIGWIGYG